MTDSLQAAREALAEWAEARKWVMTDNVKVDVEAVERLVTAEDGLLEALALLQSGPDTLRQSSETAHSDCWVRWHEAHPGRETWDVHGRWRDAPPPYADDLHEVIEAVIAALVQEGYCAWHGDGTSIVAQMIRAQSEARKATESALAAALDAAAEGQGWQDMAVSAINKLWSRSFKQDDDGSESEYRRGLNTAIAAIGDIEKPAPPVSASKPEGA